MSEIPEDILEEAREIARIAGQRYIAMGPMGFVSPIAEALMAERDRAGGAAATYFRGLLVICHPDMPPHVWDGKEMKPIGFAPANQVVRLCAQCGVLEGDSHLPTCPAISPDSEAQNG